MTRSMTGFGTATVEEGTWRIEVTIRTLNHRYLSVRIRSLNDHPNLLPRVEERVKTTFARGEVGVWVTVERSEADGPESRFDRRLAIDVLNELTSLSDELGLDTRPNLEDIVRAGGLQPVQIEDEHLWPVLEQALAAAMENANASRGAEGERLTLDVGERPSDAPVGPGRADGLAPAGPGAGLDGLEDA